MNLHNFIHMCLLNLETAVWKYEKHLLLVKNKNYLTSEVLRYEIIYRVWPTVTRFYVLFVLLYCSTVERDKVPKQHISRVKHKTEKVKHISKENSSVHSRDRQICSAALTDSLPGIIVCSGKCASYFQDLCMLTR